MAGGVLTRACATGWPGTELAAALALLLAAPFGCSLRSLDDLEAAQRSAPDVPCLDEMQQIDFEGGGTFCIDRLETTRRQFDDFLSALPMAGPIAAQADLCPDLANVTPRAGADCSEAYQEGLDPELPMTCVTLCEAMAYCQFQGKRLCGGRGGDVIELGALRDEAVNGPEQDEWYTACAGKGSRMYPYGSEAVSGICNVASTELLPVGASASCTTPEGVLDLSGNVAEWTLTCMAKGDWDSPRCLVRGGEFLTPNLGHARCQRTRRGNSEEPFPSAEPTERLPGVGIRCCSD
jgi:formylglycine-generating enzyme required for sulfatase activity